MSGSAKELVLVPFHGDTLEAVRDGDGEWAVVRRLCENIGISYPAQYRKLKRDAHRYRVAEIATRDTRGYEQPALLIHRDSIPTWLDHIHVGKVPTEVRPALERYQRECARVLAAHFLGTKVPAPAPAGPPASPAPAPSGFVQLAPDDPVIGQLVAQQQAMAALQNLCAAMIDTRRQQLALQQETATLAARQAAVEERVELVERVNAGDTGSLCILAYHKRHKRSLTEDEAKADGIKLAKYCRDHGIRLAPKVHSEKYDKTNAYPIPVLDAYYRKKWFAPPRPTLFDELEAA